MIRRNIDWLHKDSSTRITENTHNGCDIYFNGKKIRFPEIFKSKYEPFTTNYTPKIIQAIKDTIVTTEKDQLTIDTLDLCHLIGEIERLKEIIRQLDIKNLELTTIIKEVREYIEENQEEHKYTDRGGFTYTEGHFLRDSDTLLEILDKEK